MATLDIIYSARLLNLLVEEVSRGAQATAQVGVEQ